MTRLLLVRHGRSELNAVGRVQGWLDSPLDELGRAQSLAVARRLQRESPVIVYTSTLRRASETAEIIGAELGLAVVPTAPCVTLSEVKGLVPGKQEVGSAMVLPWPICQETNIEFRTCQAMHQSLVSSDKRDGQTLG